MYGFEALTFNIHSGYLEAIVRGHRSGLLTAADYNNLCQCETLDDIKMHLSATEYGPYLQNGKFRYLWSEIPDRLGIFVVLIGLFWSLTQMY